MIVRWSFRTSRPSRSLGSCSRRAVRYSGFGQSLTFSQVGLRYTPASRLLDTKLLIRILRGRVWSCQACLPLVSNLLLENTEGSRCRPRPANTVDLDQSKGLSAPRKSADKGKAVGQCAGPPERDFLPQTMTKRPLPETCQEQLDYLLLPITYVKVVSPHACR
jgi:hypothetical protein